MQSILIVVLKFIEINQDNILKLLSFENDPINMYIGSSLIVAYCIAIGKSVFLSK